MSNLAAHVEAVRKGLQVPKAPKAEKDKPVIVCIPPDLLEMIDNYRFENRFQNRTQAIHALIRLSTQDRIAP